MCPEDRPLISVIILTANRREALERCLRSLAAQAYTAFEVVVVDNGSTDGTREWLSDQTLVGDLRVLDGEASGSFAEARNRGAAAAAGTLLAFLDDDCEAKPEWLGLIAENLSRFDAVGGLCVPPDDLAFPRWWHPGMGWVVGLSGPEHRDPDLAGSLAYPQTANMALRRDVWRREAFQAVGGRLDGSEAIYQWGREDAELWRRLRLRGFRTHFDDRLVVTHHIDPTRLDWAYVCRRARHDGRSLWQREHDATYLDIAVGDLLGWPGRAVRCLGRPAGERLPSLWQHGVWRRRQMAFIMACVGDRGIKSCARPMGRVVKSWAAGWVKRLVRPVMRIVMRVLRGSLLARIPVNPESIAIASQGFLGDTVLLSPLIESLRRAWPEARLTLVGNRHGRELHARSPHLNEVIEISPPRFLFGWERWKEVRRTVRSLDADVILVPYWHGTPTWPLLMSHRIPVIGFDSDMGFRRQIWIDLLDRRVKKDFHRHEVENLLALGSSLGRTLDPPGGYELPELPSDSAHLTSLCEKHSLSGGECIALHIGATGVGKDLPDAQWGSLLKQILTERPSLRPIFIGHAHLRARVHRLIEDSGLGAVNACAARPLGDVAGILRRCRLLITTDSGPKHLAMAIGVPTVTLYAHSSETRWGAWVKRDRHTAVISPGHDLRPEELGPRGPGHKMALIRVEETMAAVRAILDTPAPPDGGIDPP